MRWPDGMESAAMAAAAAAASRNRSGLGQSRHSIAYIGQGDWLALRADFLGVSADQSSYSVGDMYPPLPSTTANCSLAANSTCLPPPPGDPEFTWQLVFSPSASLAIAAVVIVCSLVTFGGNLLVFVAFFLEKKLQITNNYFLLSLAVADGFVGLVSVNLWLMLYLGNSHWPFGWYACVTWIFWDYTWCTTSIYHVFIISIDRYWSVSYPASYRQKMNARTAFTMIVPTWAVSIVWWAMLIVGHPLLAGRMVIEGMCYANYWGIGILTYLSTSITYWIPVVVITTLYIHIFRIARKLKRKRREKSALYRRQLLTAAKTTTMLQKLRKGALENAEAEQQSSRACMGETTSKVKVEVIPLSTINEKAESKASNHSPDSGIEDCSTKPPTLPRRAESFTVTVNHTLSESEISSVDGGPHSQRSLRKSGSLIKVMRSKTSLDLKKLTGKKKSSSSSRQSNDKKAMKTLTCLLGAFIVCWTPWNIAEVVNGIWGPETVNSHLYQFTWLLTYINSGLNPICYAFANTLFRDTFIRILSLGRIDPARSRRLTATRKLAK